MTPLEIFLIIVVILLLVIVIVLGKFAYDVAKGIMDGFGR